MIQDTAFFMSA